MTAIKRAPGEARSHSGRPATHGGNLKVEYRAVATLKPDPRNPRTYTPAQIDKLAKLIGSMGWTNPILVDGKNGIVAGHGRLQAAKQLGMQRVPVIELSGLTAAQKRAYLLADNRAALDAGWDPDLLATEFAALKDMGFDLTLTGFELPEIAFALEPEEPDPEEPPTPALQRKPISKVGDLWLLGEHRVLCGDATKPAHLEALTRGRKANMVFTDPPYGVSYVARSGEFEMIQGDDLRRGQLADLLRKSFAAALPHTTEDAGWYVWHASATREDYAAALRDTGLVELGYLIWAKPQMVLGWADYRWAHEPCFYAARQGVRPAWHGGRNQTTVWRISAGGPASGLRTAIGQGVTIATKDGEIHVSPAQPKGKKIRHLHLSPGQALYLEAGSGTADLWEVSRDNGHGKDNALHPNQKPVELARRAIANSSAAGGIVLDMFAGAGSTLMGAEQLGRTCYALELDPLYVDVTLRRWQAATRRAATHAKDKRSFDATAQARTKGKA